ncbi:MAG: DUF2520 domain-containing protein [Taibaiella sp.]|nr:DUF2520 domain-containing protein [Taibaiella sp.]
MTYNIIGTGNMAWFLARRLKAAGYKCAGIYSRNARAVTGLAKEVYAGSCGAISDVKDNADVCILAVSDHAIESLASHISLENSVLIHTAGSIDIEATAASAPDRAVMWPVYSILKADIPLHRNIPCAWEASSDKARYHVSEIMNAFTDMKFEAKADQRHWLHLTAVMSNNFINHLMAIGEQVCKAQGLPFTMLQPILQQTFDRMAVHSPMEVQTGPARRGDMLTINRHLNLLKANPEWAAVYQAISTSIEKMYNSNK